MICGHPQCTGSHNTGKPNLCPRSAKRRYDRHNDLRNRRYATDLEYREHIKRQMKERYAALPTLKRMLTMEKVIQRRRLAREQSL